MRLIDILLNGRDDRHSDADRRKARRARRPALDSLEGRVVLSTASPFVGPLPSQPAVVSTASATPASTTTITADQQGVAFGMQWRCVWDSQIGQYRLDVQGVPGAGNVVVARTKVGIQFQTTQFNASSGRFETVSVAGPALHMNKYVQIRQFRDAGDVTLSVGTGLYRSLSTQARTNVSYVSTPTGQIKLTYQYNSIQNTGTLTVDNIQGSGRIVYSKSFLNPSPGDPAPQSPTANPVQSIDFQLQSNGSYNGGVNVFVPGKADPTITVVINNNNRAGYYQLDRGVW